MPSIHTLLRRFYWVGTLAGCLWLAGCNSPFLPRPNGYFAINLPKHAYQHFNDPGYPYQFEYPVYARIVRDTSFFGEAPENPWWINIEFPELNGKIYVSYNRIGGRATFKIKKGEDGYVDSIAVNTLPNLIDGSYKLSYRHSSRASSIEDSLLTTQRGIQGVYFKVGGNAATANQFFLTDSVKHFLRGALYFDTTPNEDSLRPVNQFLMQDMLHLINTFAWRE